MAVSDPVTKRIWCRSDRYTSGGNSRKYIAIHNTANTATAEQEAKNLHDNAGQSSFQYVVDDVDIIQCVHDYDTAWAVGAWAGAVQYIGNNQSISIEVCNPGTEFSDACKRNLRALVRHLMDYYGIPADHVVRHWDCHSGRKQCPKFYSGSNNAAWNALHSYITDNSGDDDMTNEEHEWLRNINDAITWNNENHFSRMGNLIAEYPKTYKNAEGKDETQTLGNRIAYIDLHTHVVDIKLAAIEAALSTLAGAMGADANTIAKAVSDAVEKKLEAIDLTVTVNE